MNSIYVALNILRRISKEKAAFLAQVLAPVLIGLIMFSLISVEPVQKKETIGISNNDKGIYGAMLADKINKLDGYNILLYSKDEMEKKVIGKKVTAGIMIPEEFSKDIEDGKKTSVGLYKLKQSVATENLKVIINTYLSNIYISRNVSQAIDNSGRLNITQELLSGMDQKIVSSKEEILTSKKDTTKDTIVFGFFIMFILQFSVLGVGLILEDKKEKTFMRTYCAPVKNSEIVFGNLLANLFMGMFMIGIFMILARFIYNINAGWGIFIVLCACLVTSIGYAIGISGLVKDNEKYMAITGPIAGFMCIMGGCFIPLDMLPSAMRKISGAIPTRWAMDGITKLLNGGKISDVYMDIVILLLFGAVLIIFGIKTLKPNVEDL